MMNFMADNGPMCRDNDKQHPVCLQCTHPEYAAELLSVLFILILLCT